MWYSWVWWYMPISISFPTSKHCDTLLLYSLICGQRSSSSSRSYGHPSHLCISVLTTFRYILRGRVNTLLSHIPTAYTRHRTLTFMKCEWGPISCLQISFPIFTAFRALWQYKIIPRVSMSAYPLGNTQRQHNVYVCVWPFVHSWQTSMPSSITLRVDCCCSSKATVAFSYTVLTVFTV